MKHFPGGKIITGKIFSVVDYSPLSKTVLTGIMSSHRIILFTAMCNPLNCGWQETDPKSGASLPNQIQIQLIIIIHLNIPIYYGYYIQNVSAVVLSRILGILKETL